jgi:spoIIIJ-associated protein
MRYFEVEGDSPAEILKQFAIQQNIPQEYIKMEVIDPGAKGMLGFGKKPAKVKLIFDDYEYLKRKAKLYLSEILDNAGFDSYHIEVEDKKPVAVLNILTNDSNLLIGKSAITLDSLQYLVDRVVRPMDTDVGIVVDVDGYRKRVVAPLRDKAVKLAQSVKKTGRPAKMSPMVTFVRREIHIAAKSVEDISTISNGEGQIKSVTIFSTKKQPNSGSRGNRRPPDRRGHYRDKTER